VAHTKTERQVLGEVECPFIVKLYAAFQCERKLYLVLDYCAGGELFYHLSRAGRFPVRVTQFYVSEIVVALQHLHERDFVYRDMKPENVLLDSNGHVKLADFGLAKGDVHDATSGANSLCGTPEYLAPEVLARTGHGQAVDWWGLGMLSFEMLTGLPPWYTKDRWQLILNLRSAPLVFPSCVPMDEFDPSFRTRHFVSRLLDRDPHTRLGGGGAAEVMSHTFLAAVDWQKLASLEVAVPIKPCKHMRTDSDLMNFSTQFTSMKISSADHTTANGTNGRRSGNSNSNGNGGGNSGGNSGGSRGGNSGGNKTGNKGGRGAGSSSGSSSGGNTSAEEGSGGRRSSSSSSSGSPRSKEYKRGLSDEGKKLYIEGLDNETFEGFTYETAYTPMQVQSIVYPQYYPY
jgi:serine/threonine protein kinase